MTSPRSHSEVAREPGRSAIYKTLGHAGLGEASEDRREWTRREEEKCFTIKQGQESKRSYWNADESPGGQVETTC